MNSHGILQLREPIESPRNELLEQVLGDSYTAYEAFQEGLPSLEIEQEWQWYTPHKAWFAKGQHFWETARGTRKEKNLYWIYFYEGFFTVAVWFKEKNRSEILRSNVSDKTKELIRNAETAGKVPTFPVLFDVTGTQPIADMYTLIDCKKRLEK